MGMGMILLLLSALCTPPNSSQFLDINSYSLIVQNSLNAIGYILLYIAAYEFICSQSPHAMKGLLIGTFFAIKGVFQLLGIVMIFAPFTS